MRFFDFYRGALPVYDAKKQTLKNLSESNICLSESQESVSRTNYVRDFLKDHITDPKELIIGREYYPIYIFAHPAAATIRLEAAQFPVTYEGVLDENFVFIGTREFRLPISHETVEDYGSLMYATTVYATPAECDQLITLMVLKFQGDWRLEQKRLPV